MKKLFLITFILTCFSCLGQNNPDRFPDGIGTKLIDPLGNTTAEINAFTNNALGRLAFNTDEGKWKRWDGSAWVDAFSGGSSPEFYTVTGTGANANVQIGNGDYSVLIDLDFPTNTITLEYNTLILENGVTVNGGDVIINDINNNELGLEIRGSSTAISRSTNIGFSAFDNNSLSSVSLFNDGAENYVGIGKNPVNHLKIKSLIDGGTVGAPKDITVFFPNLTANDTIVVQSKLDAAIAGIGSVGHTIQNNGTPLTSRPNLNFVDGLLAEDNTGNTSTDVNLDYTKVIKVADNSPVKDTEFWIGNLAQWYALYPYGTPAPDNYFKTITDSVPAPLTGSDIILDTSNFDNNLNNSITNTQLLAEAVNDLSISAGSGVTITTITKYTNVSSLPSITGNENDVYAYVTEDADLSLRGLYVIEGAVWKLLYHFEDLKQPVKKVSVNEIDLSQPELSSTTDATEEGIINGYRLNASADGVTVSASNYISNFIPVKFGDRLKSDGSSIFWFYDHNKQPLLWSEGIIPYNFSDLITIDNEKVKYIRWSGVIANKGVSGMVVKQQNLVSDAAPTGWVDYHGAADNYQRDNNNYTYEANGVIWDNLCTNLFDKSKAEYHRAFTNTGTVVTSQFSSGFIPIQAGLPYAHNTGNNQYITFWDENFTFVSGTVAQFALAPTGSYYMTMGFARTTDLDALIIQQGTSTQPVKHTEVTSNNMQEPYTVSKTVCLIGDSIGTENGSYATASSYASMMRETLLIDAFHNISVSGRSLAQYRLDINQGVYNTPFADLYIVALGTNDFGYNIGIGSLADTSATNSFYGAMDGLIDGILSINPNADIVFTTPVSRGTQFTANAAGHVLKDYRDAIIKRAITLGYNYIDLFNAGFNPINLTTQGNWASDDTHPNTEGHRAFFYSKVVPVIKTHL